MEENSTRIWRWLSATRDSMDLAAARIAAHPSWSSSQSYPPKESILSI